MNAHAAKRQVEPRGLYRESAAAYIGVSPSKFDELVHDGRMPHPKVIDRRKVWDRYALDVAFEQLPDDGDTENWFDKNNVTAI